MGMVVHAAPASVKLVIYQEDNPLFWNNAAEFTWHIKKKINQSKSCKLQMIPFGVETKSSKIFINPAKEIVAISDFFFLNIN